jgi:hypothetical protein
MTRPRVQVTREESRYNFALGGGVDPGTEVRGEFLEIGATHELVSEGGGLYEVNALDPAGGRTLRFLGGMYVPGSKRDAVWTDLTALGYELSNSD